MQGSLSGQELVLHHLSSCLLPVPPFCGLKVQETSDPSYLFSSSLLPVSSLIMTLCYTTSDYPQNLVVNRMTMRCLTRPSPPCTYDSDVVATLNDDSVVVDVDKMSMLLLLAKRYDKSMLFDLVKHPNMQVTSKHREDALGVFVASHLSAGEYAYLR